MSETLPPTDRKAIKAIQKSKKCGRKKAIRLAKHRVLKKLLEAAQTTDDLKPILLHLIEGLD